MSQPSSSSSSSEIQRNFLLNFFTDLNHTFATTPDYQNFQSSYPEISQKLLDLITQVETILENAYLEEDLSKIIHFKQIFTQVGRYIDLKTDLTLKTIKTQDEIEAFIDAQRFKMLKGVENKVDDGKVKDVKISTDEKVNIEKMDIEKMDVEKTSKNEPNLEKETPDSEKILDNEINDLIISIKNRKLSPTDTLFYAYNMHIRQVKKYFNSLNKYKKLVLISGQNEKTKILYDLYLEDWNKWKIYRGAWLKIAKEAKTLEENHLDAVIEKLEKYSEKFSDEDEKRIKNKIDYFKRTYKPITKEDRLLTCEIICSNRDLEIAISDFEEARKNIIDIVKYKKAYIDFLKAQKELLIWWEVDERLRKEVSARDNKVG